MKLGRQFKLGFVDSDGVFTPFAFAQSATIDYKTATTEVSSPLTGGTVNRRPKRTSWSMQHEGLLGYDNRMYTIDGKTFGFYALMRYLWRNRRMLTARWVEDGLDGTIQQGECIIENMKHVASEKALTKVSVSLSGSGELQELDANNLTGQLAYSMSGTKLTLFVAGEQPIADFTVKVGSTTVGTWTATGGRVQTFTAESTLSGAVTAWRGSGASEAQQTGVTFTDSTTLHVVLLQTEWRDEQQQLHRAVQPLWWGGTAMGDMTLTCNGSTVATFSTTGKTGSSEAVEINPAYDITSNSYTWILTIAAAATGAAAQTVHCTDRTTSLRKTIRVYQTTNHYGASPYMAQPRIVGGVFGCDFEVWSNDAEGTRLFTWESSQADPTLTMAGLVAATGGIHWQLTGLGVDESGPYQIDRELVTDTATHDVWYAYDSTAQRLRIWCPTQEGETYVTSNGGHLCDTMYDTDAQGNRIPLTVTGVTSATGISALYGEYTFRDVTALQVMNLSNTYTINVLPLDDIILTASGTEIGRIPALSSPDGTYTFPGAVADGAEMASGAAQTVTFSAYPQTFVVSTKVTQTGNAAWAVVAYINLITDGEAGGNATHPANLILSWPGVSTTMSIPAGQSSATLATFSDNPAWITPTVTSESWASDTFRISVAPTVDVTPAKWRADYLGIVGTQNLYDISFTESVGGQTVVLSGDYFLNQTGLITLDDGRKMCDSLLSTNRSVGDWSFYVKTTAVGQRFQITATSTVVRTNNPVQLMYVEETLSSGAAATNLTNVFNAVASRHTNIGDLLKFVRVRDNTSGHETYQDAPIYHPVSLSKLKPGQPDVVSEAAYPGWKSYSNTIAEFVNSQDPSDTNVISVSTGLTGLIIHDPSGHTMAMA